VSRISRPSPALVIALVSLFVSLSGVVYAAATIGSSDIKNNSIKGKDVRDDNLTGADVSEGTLGKVPSATEADSATKADSATAALNATNAANATNAQTATSAGTAQTANSVAPLGVDTAAIANQSITGTKIKFPIIRETEQATSVPAHDTDTASVACGGGERMIGGGGQFTGSSSPLHVILESYPESAGSGGVWTVRGFNDTATTTPLVARVVCIPDN
jgi:hypothetical protein